MRLTDIQRAGWVLKVEKTQRNQREFLMVAKIEILKYYNLSTIQEKDKAEVKSIVAILKIYYPKFIEVN